MSILVVHPGTQHAHHLVAGLLAKGRDVEYSTVLSFGTNSRWESVLPKSTYSKRALRNIPDRIIDRHPMLEAIPGVLQRLGVSAPHAYRVRNNMFQTRIGLRKIRSSSAIIGFDTSSLIVERKAVKENVPFFLELTQVHPLEKRKWSDFLGENYPQWPQTLLEKPADLIAEENEELALATIVSAPGQFVKQAYQNYSKTKNEIVINPFGADLVSFKPKTSYKKKRPTFVFMGQITPIKGVPVLLDAWKLAKPDAELVIGGPGELPRGVEVPEGVRLAGRIAKDERENFLHTGDIFLCPSLYEGLAIVQLEAAACGLPVIGTHNSGGSEFLRDGQEGFFVEPGNVTALAEKISYFAQRPDECERMGRGAAVRAGDYTWDAYVTRWLAIIDKYTVK